VKTLKKFLYPWGTFAYPHLRTTAQGHPWSWLGLSGKPPLRSPASHVL